MKDKILLLLSKSSEGLYFAIFGWGDRVLNAYFAILAGMGCKPIFSYPL